MRGLSGVTDHHMSLCGSPHISFIFAFPDQGAGRRSRLHLQRGCKRVLGDRSQSRERFDGAPCCKGGVNLYGGLQSQFYIRGLQHSDRPRGEHTSVHSSTLIVVRCRLWAAAVDTLRPLALVLSRRDVGASAASTFRREVSPARAAEATYCKLDGAAPQLLNKKDIYMMPSVRPIQQAAVTGDPALQRKLDGWKQATAEAAPCVRTPHERIWFWEGVSLQCAQRACNV
jgi:hypothetical protein